MLFWITDAERAQNVERYALFANRSDDFNGRDALPSEYMLTVRAYDENRATGNVLADQTITFTLSP